MRFAIAVSFLLGSCALCLLEATEKSNPRVITPLGMIEGFYNTSNAGRLYEAYEGIPFARPPTGKFRFRVAKSISPWTGVLMAKQFSSPCMQYNFELQGSVNKVSGSEDCLYLNIYTPAADDSSRKVNETTANLLPVIFFIPGGAFLIGSGNQYGPKYLLDRNVMLVTINYRLGPLGFLSTEDEIVPGNMGLKDQVIALRWVKDNIRSFGGDPSRITISGQSAGAASVHYHYLTNLTAGLFQRGISMSGTALHPWSLVKNPLEKAKKLATVMGCSTEKIQDMVECLRDRPAHQIINALSNFTESVFFPTHGWGPSVEKGAGEFTFIDRQPIDIIASGDAQDVPWITGVVSEEALYPMSYFISDEQMFVPLNDEWDRLASQLLYFTDTIPRITQLNVARLIKHHYLGESPISRTTFNQTRRMVGDRCYFYSSENSARSLASANKSPVHVYYFSYRGAHSHSETYSGTSENFGVCHGDDLAYILDASLDTTTTADDREMQNLLINLWVSFATDGTPDVGVEWPSLKESFTDEYSYLHIAGPTEIGMESSLNFGEKKFWRTLGVQENIPSFEANT